MKIVGIVGSLRGQSSNAAVLRATAAVAPAGVTLTLHHLLGTLPHFNPDLDGEGATPPAPVAELRATLTAADAILICSPEYAHGVPGALKNLLDWLVSTPELVGKPVGVLSVSPSGGEYAQAQLVRTLATMSWCVVDEACARISLGRAQLDDQGELVDPALIELVRRCVAALAAAG